MKHSPNFAQARCYARNRLMRELSPQLFYHSLRHTQDDVVPAVERLATCEGIDHEGVLLLCTAAWYHDLGCIYARVGHEEHSARIAIAVLPDFGYTPAQVAQIYDLILATRIPQQPQTLLAAILADADLDNLGRMDFLYWSLALKHEIEATGRTIHVGDWYRRQLQFLQTHRFWTFSSRLRNNPGKYFNMRLLTRLQARTNPHDRSPQDRYHHPLCAWDDPQPHHARMWCKPVVARQ